MNKICYATLIRSLNQNFKKLAVEVKIFKIEFKISCNLTFQFSHLSFK